MGLVRKILQRCGVDRAIAYTVIGRSWTFFAGPISLLLIAHFLTGEEQGFYYTFGSVLGLYIFFELGLSFVIFQFASHEKAKLAWSAEGTLEGDPLAKERLFSLVRKALVWYTLLAGLVLALLVPSGLAFFNGYNRTGNHPQVSWQFPWIWVVTATAADLLSGPLVAVLEGGGLFTEIAFMRAIQMIAGGLLTWLVLALHGHLLAAPVSNTVVVVVWWGWFLGTKRNFLRQILGFRDTGHGIDWKSEVWPFQWRIALTGISSYFIYLLFNPVLFKYQGATVAGQMGMSTTVLTAVSTVAVSWISTKMSPFGALIAQREYRKLDELFFPALWKSLAVFLSLGALFLLLAHGLDVIHHPLARRLLPLTPLSILLATSLMNHIVGAEALYLRAHKQEPFLVLSVTVAVLTAVTTYYLARNYSALAMIIGNFVVTSVFSLAWGTYIFVRKRHEWHGEISPALDTPLIEQCPNPS